MDIASWHSMQPPDGNDIAAPERRGFRRFWPRSLRMRLAIPFVGMVVFVLLILYVALGERTQQVYIDRLSDELHDQATLAADDIGRQLGGGADTPAIASLVDRLGARTGSRFTLVDADGTVLADSEADPATMENHNTRPEVVEARRNGSGESERTSGTVGYRFLYVAVPVDEPDGLILRIAVPLDDVYATVEAAQRSILITIGAAMVLAGLIAWLIAGYIARPLEDLRAQARSVAAGDFAARVDPSDTWELGAVGEAFNLMTAELARLVRQQEQTSMRLEAVLAGLADGVVLTDEEGRVLRLNAAAEQLLEVDEASVVDTPFVQVCRDHEMAQVLRLALHGNPAPRATVMYGIQRRQLTTTAKIVEGAHERLGLVVLRDVTELRRLERVRREFVANVSHELRTPLTSIRAVVETLQTGAVDDPALAAEFLSRILGEVDRLNALVEDLLDLARLEAGRSPLGLERVDIGEVVRHGVDRLRPQLERARLALEFEVDPELPTIEVDVKRIEQVLLNLIHNAIKFTPPEGRVAISVTRDSGDVTVRVRDTGIGIAEEERGRLFERFYKSDKARRSEGTGLGLAIAKHIIQLHGGEIGVESALGEGATFWFTLPIKRKRARRRARRYLLEAV